MTSTIVLGIDGTGPMFTESYRQAMRMSFVRYILVHTPTRNRRYLHGPGLDGFDMTTISAEGYSFVHLCKSAEPDARVLLTGYSRGASGVVDVAVRLAKDNVIVDGMMLLDAVDRSPFPSVLFSGYEIPNNVLRVVHATRDAHSFSRASFGNSATKWHAPTKYEARSFWATHGALGGVPEPTDGHPNQFVDEGFPEATPSFVTHDEDHAGARHVWSWAEPRLHSMGFL